MTKKEVEKIQLAIKYFNEDEPTLANCGFDDRLYRKAMKEFHGQHGGMRVLSDLLKTHYQRKKKNV
jgi:hypothetical protein